MNSPWVTSYFPIQKSREIVTGYLIRMKVPAFIKTMLVNGTSTVFARTGDDSTCLLEGLEDRLSQPD